MRRVVIDLEDLEFDSRGWASPGVVSGESLGEYRSSWVS